MVLLGSHYLHYSLCPALSFLQYPHKLYLCTKTWCYHQHLYDAMFISCFSLPCCNGLIKKKYCGYPDPWQKHCRSPSRTASPRQGQAQVPEQRQWVTWPQATNSGSHEQPVPGRDCAVTWVTAAGHEERQRDGHATRPAAGLWRRLVPGREPHSRWETEIWVGIPCSRVRLDIYLVGYEM